MSKSGNRSHFGNSFHIRKAMPYDFMALYEFAKSVEELQVVKGRDFMTQEDFHFAIENSNGIFLVAELNSKLIGFSYAAIEGPTYAALMYTAVSPLYRRKGIATMLSNDCITRLRELGIKQVYSLATNQHIIDLRKKLGFQEGKQLTYLQMDL